MRWNKNFFWDLQHVYGSVGFRSIIERLPEWLLPQISSERLQKSILAAPLVREYIFEGGVREYIMTSLQLLRQTFHSSDFKTSSNHGMVPPWFHHGSTMPVL